MNIKVSLPPQISEEAKKIASEMEISLDKFFELALYHYISAYRSEAVTEVLNNLYEKESASIDPTLLKMQSASLDKELW